ncbi:MAG TPA: histidine kinase [Actinomycetota bacterium]|jgi:signal transduction histidine kinase|nr:histidine kinase [Actinomycetota bacterium]
MSRRNARILSLVVIGVCAVAVAVSTVMFVGMPPDPHPDRIVVIGDPTAERVAAIRAEVEARIAAGEERLVDDSGLGAGVLLVVALCFGWMAVGSLIVSRQPTNWAGWTFLAIGATLPLLTLAQTLVVRGARIDPGSVPGVGAVAVLGEYLLYPVALLPLLFLLYPDGHVPSPRWRWAVRGLIGGTALALLGFALRPGPLNNWVDAGILYVNPIGIDGFGSAAGALISIGAFTALIAALSTVVAVIGRYRASSGEARQQMRLLRLVAAVAGLSLSAGFVLGLAGEALGIGGNGSDPFFDIPFFITVFVLVIGTPAAYLVAIFRHGLWDLDVVIKKTAQYAVVVGGLTVAGFVVVGVIPALVFGVGGDADVVPVLVLATILSALFLWLRPRAARIAGRLVYGRRATPYEVLSEFSERVGDTYSTDDVLPRMARLVAEATGARRSDVWLATGSDLSLEASWPIDASSLPSRAVVDGSAPSLEGEYMCEVRQQEELLGAITLRPDPADPMDGTKEALVRDLAAQAGLVLRNVRLIGELRASRQRLVTAQDEERRRLERNIHDGVQQQLVALQVQLKLASTMVERDPSAASELLGTLADASAETLGDLRDLARGIYPPLLADQGLRAALQAQARKAAVPTTVSVDDVGRYQQEVEAAVYFSVLEALNNVSKYAEATAAEVAIAQHDGSLRFRVTDDGRGFDPATTSRGTGLQGITDRLDAIGGEVRIESAPGAGTTVTGSVPVG